MLWGGRQCFGSRPAPLQYQLFRKFGSSEYGKTFDKILVANRGEIACRVIRTARRMGIRSVAIYSEADANAMHVRMADEAYLVGPAPSSQSYLRVDRIMEAVERSGAQAVHPGYGFLSENAAFCAALEAANVAFIGPPSRAIQRMGDKIESKAIAKAAGVSIIPGFDGVVADEGMALRAAQEIGYPVMLKASAGGGGKGMRIAWDAAGVRENFRLAAAEAKASFGDGRLLVEKYIEEPRHVEIQLIGDRHGNMLYLPERECSVQRRNQKVLEEAPSTALDAATRLAMGQQAVALARSVGYHSAGTVEFLVDRQRRFYFLEMNTRLQVEHPVTELVTGIDLVEQMIRVAAGHELGLAQRDVSISGWAVESRVYAEDPRTFLPCIGRLSRYSEPAGQHVRCDSGVREGSDIPVYYDPLICKLSTWGPSRDAALDRMATALDSYVIQGVTHNIPLLREVVGHAAFRSGRYSTKLLPEAFPKGFQGHALAKAESDALAAIASHVHWAQEARAFAANNSAMGAADEPAVVSIGGIRRQSVKGAEGYAIDGGHVQCEIDWALDSPLIQATIDGRRVTAQYLGESAGTLRLAFLGTHYAVQLQSQREAELARHMLARPKPDLSRLVRAPMPGQIVSVAVRPGDLVEPGAELLVMEAMKMQNVIRASKAGKVAKVAVSAGQSVAAEQDLLLLGDIE